jgi:methionyl-tRNA formyltransferase
MNIIFMGTPLFALPALKAILESKNHRISSVFSQRPKARGRGMKVTESPVHEFASKHDIPVYTPSTLRNEDADKLIKSIEADIIVVAAYGFIIPKNILEAKKYGCLNIHPSDLPKYRGAAPLQRTIINGESETAVCIMQMDEGLDTGDILAEEKFLLSKKITFAELHDNTSKLGAQMLMHVLDNIENIKAVKQSTTGVLYAHKLSKEESKIDWNETAFAIDCKIRGMNPWPGVYFTYQNKKIKIIEAEYIDIDHKYDPGIILDNSSFFEISCSKGILRIILLQPEGKRIMSAKDYLLGFNNKHKHSKILG